MLHVINGKHFGLILINDGTHYFGSVTFIHSTFQMTLLKLWHLTLASKLRRHFTFYFCTFFSEFHNMKIYFVVTRKKQPEWSINWIQSVSPKDFTQKTKIKCSGKPDIEVRATQKHPQHSYIDLMFRKTSPAGPWNKLTVSILMGLSVFSHTLNRNRLNSKPKPSFIWIKPNLQHGER